MTRPERLSILARKLIYEENFWGLYLVSLNKVWTESVKTMGVGVQGINYMIYINPHFFDSLSDNHVKGVLKHELQHIGFQHLTLRDKYPKKDLINIAMDMHINQYNKREWLPGGEFSSLEDYQQHVKPLVETLNSKLENNQITQEEYQIESIKLPSRGVFLEDYKELNLEKLQSSDYYYKKLLEDWDEKNNKSKSGCKTLEGMMPSNGGEEMHDSWGDLDDLSDVQKKLLKEQTDFQLKQIAEQVRKSRGTIPGELAGYLDSLDVEEPPKFNWKAYLRQFIDGTEMNDFMSTRKRLNRRFGGNPGKRVIPKKHVLVGVDTSGSVSDAELQEFFHEIGHMYKTGSDVTVIHCDTTIQKVEKYNPKEKIQVYGRGGTDFTPVINHYNEHKNEYTCLIYVTDGEAPVPETRIQGKMLWVLSSKSNDQGHWVDQLREYAPLIKLN